MGSKDLRYHGISKELDIPLFFEEVNKIIFSGQEHYLEVVNFDQESIIEILNMHGLRTGEKVKFYTHCYFSDIDDNFYGDSKLGGILANGLEFSEESDDIRDSCELVIMLRGTVYRTIDYGDEEEDFVEEDYFSDEE